MLNSYQLVNEHNPSSEGVTMLDARPFANAVANKGRHGGYEDAVRFLPAADTGNKVHPTVE